MIRSFKNKVAEDIFHGSIPGMRENFPLTYIKKHGDCWINLMLHQQLTFSKCRLGTDWRGCPATIKIFGV